MKILNVMSLDWTYKAGLQGFSSAVVTRQWSGIGVLNLEINSEIPNADLIQEDDILWFDKEYHKAYIVERIEEVLENGTVVYSITAPSVDCLLKDYITVPPTGQGYDVVTGTREQVVRAWVDHNCITPDDVSRAQYPIVLGDLKGLGDSITEQTRYKPLDEEISRVLGPQDLGWGLTLDIPNERFVFEVYQGVDRTINAPDYAPRVIFGLQYGNIAGYKKTRDKTAARTSVYVGGQGEGADRTIVKVEPAGFSGRRKEMFVDARDTDLTADLQERGRQALIEAEQIRNFEFETLDRQFRYEQEYDLGDYVTVVQDKETYQDLQIKVIRETYERGRLQVVPEFGKPQRTIGKLINTISTRVAALETSEVTSDTGDIDGGGV